MHNEKKFTFQDFPVIKDFGDEENFFRISTPGGEVTLQKLEFQKGQPLPDTLNCRIKGYDGELPVLGHNMARYVSEFYADGNSRGLEFAFRVFAQPSAEHPYYRLTDNNGLQFKLHDTKSTLATGQLVKCRFERLDAYGFSIRRSSADSDLRMLRIKDLMKDANLYGLLTSKDIDELLHTTPELHNAATELDEGHPTWIFSAIHAITQSLPKWFTNHVLSTPFERVDTLLRSYRQACTHLLQGSNFMRDVDARERQQLQATLIAAIEQADVFSLALDTINKKRQEKFIKRMLDNLKASGYLYRPHLHLAVMMILFRVSPELANRSMSDIFDTLMEWSPETWMAEPFRRAFVDQLESYISDTGSKIDSFLEPASPDENETVEKVLTAIAIQHALANADDEIDMARNMSMFYRFLSVLRPAKAETLLNKAYLAMMGVRLPIDFTWRDIKETTMMMTRAAVDAPSTAVIPAGRQRYFFSGDLEVEVGNEGIALSLASDPDVDNVLSNGMIDWPGAKINVRIAHPMNRTKIKSLDGHNEFWKEVEDAIFDTEEQVTVEVSGTKFKPDRGDEVHIIIDRVTETKQGYLFHCLIDDPSFQGEGWLNEEDMVRYRMHGISAGTFRFTDGSPMRLPAIVKDIDDNDNIIFEMLPYTDEATRELATTGDTALCVITKDNGASYSAISEKGYGLYVARDKGVAPFRSGTVIRYSVTGYNGAVSGVYEEGPIDGYKFENARAVHFMMKYLAIDPPEQTDTDPQLDDEDMLSKQDINLIIEIFRYKALSLRNDVIRAFDYLSLAHILARAIGNDAIADVIYAHKEALRIYQSFDKNKQIYLDDVERVDSLAPDSALIKRLCDRLRIVAALGNSEENPALWDVCNSTRPASDKELAQMVLSYNFLYDLNHDDEAAAQIKEKIARMLNVSSEQRNLKYYGSESQYVEFKSSIVYPARKGKSGISLADPDKQEFEILHIIAGFLNSTGGTLYIGVSDDHYERGLSEDFAFYKMDQSERNTPFRRKIKTLDNLTNYLQQLIDKRFSIGMIAGDYAKTSIDDEAVKGVAVVKIEPCPHIVELDGEIYVRHGSKTEPIIDQQEKEMFIEDRKARFKRKASDDSAAEPSNPAPVVSSPTPEKTQTKQHATDDSKSDTTDAPTASGSQLDIPKYPLATSVGRHNVIHEFDDYDHFVTPDIYIRFLSDNRYMTTNDEWSLDDSELLVLAIKAEETDGYLVLVYEGEAAVKVPMREILKKKSGTLLPLFAGRKLVFAGPASDDDGLYAILTNSKGSIMERLTPVSDLEQGTLTSQPPRLLDVEVNESPFWTIVPAERIQSFSTALSTQMKRTQVGTLVKNLDPGRPTVEAAVAQARKKLTK